MTDPYPHLIVRTIFVVHTPAVDHEDNRAYVRGAGSYLTWSSPAMRLISALDSGPVFFANALINGL